MKLLEILRGSSNMGHCKKVLSSKTVQAVPTFLSNQAVLELAENFHFHYRNYRLEMDYSEFESMSLSFIEAYAKWNLGGRKKSVRYKYAGDRNIVLSKFSVNSHPCLESYEASVNNIRAEINQNADHIHIHYKDFRFELSLSEFDEFASVLEEAKSKLKKVISDTPSPERIGFFHRSVPFGRVDDPLNKNYWLYPQDCGLENVYESTYSTEGDSGLIANRETDSASNYKIHIDDLFTSTLRYKSLRSPHGCDESGIFIPLLNRYKFVKFYFENSQSLTDKQIESTDYFKLLKAGFDANPRDGESKAVYADPLAQAHRFIELINSVTTSGYVVGGEKIGAFNDEVVALHTESGDVVPQTNRLDIEKGLITIYMELGLPQVHNGLHRLAILKYLNDHDLVSDPLVLVHCLDSKKTPLDRHRPIHFDKDGFPVGSLRWRDYTFGEIYLKLQRGSIGIFSVLTTSIFVIVEKSLRFITKK